jgi:hypothetical protein
MRQDDDLDIALAATSAIIDRGWGRPAQMVTGNPDQPLAFEIVWGPARGETPEVQAPVIDAQAQPGDAEEVGPIVVWQDGSKSSG